MGGLGPLRVLLAVALLLGATGSAIAGGATAPAATLLVSASATPSAGTAPLLVQFSSSVSSGTPTAYNWSFGDGSYLNGTNPSAGDPSHLYDRPGVFTAVLVVHEGSATGEGSVPVDVSAAPLSVQVTARPLSGVVPLTVAFSGTVTGGTGTYLDFNWTFGDGGTGTGSSVLYTYERPGHFYATLEVEDSNGSKASGGSWVNVSADGPVGAAGLTQNGEAEWAAVGFALGIAIAVAVFPLRAWLSRRQAKDAAPARSSAAVAVTAGSSEAVPAPPSAGAEPPEPGTVPPGGEALRTSQRVLIHLAGQGTIGPYDVAPPGVTQAGISAALGVRQNALTNVMRRLTDAGLVETEVRHVQGQPRRLKVYRLTPRGQILARELRQRRPPRPDE